MESSTAGAKEPSRLGPALSSTRWTNPNRVFQDSADASRSASAAVSFGEPPKKRLKVAEDFTGPQTSLLGESKFQKCLKDQIFPHVDRALGQLTPGVCNVEQIGLSVVGLATGPHFDEEFACGNGTLSTGYESQLADAVHGEVRRLASLPEYRLRHASSTTPPVQVRIPILPPASSPQPHRKFTVRSQAAPRPSTSEARVPRHTGNAGTQASEPRQQFISPNSQADPIVISSDEEDDEEAEPEVRPIMASSHKKAQTDPADEEEVNQEPRKDDGMMPNGDSDMSNSSHVASEESLQSVSTASPARRVTHMIQSSRRAQRVRNAPIYNLKELTYAHRTSNFSSSPARRKQSRLQTAAPKQIPTSPENYRTRAHAWAWRRDEPGVTSKRQEATARSLWFSGARRPYLSLVARKGLLSSARKLLKTSFEQPKVVHVDFTPAEIECLRTLACRILDLPATSPKLFRKQNRIRLVQQLPAAAKREGKLTFRTVEDIRNFLADLPQKSASIGQIMSLARDNLDRYGALVRTSRVHSLLLAREVGGSSRWAYIRSAPNFTNEFRKWHEDNLELRTEWTNCAGDISTIVWVSDDAFICGTTEHSDSHNQQYNKPGNLVLGSCISDTLQAYPDHRVVRPIVEKGENATFAMRESQDPWLYSSVVCSDYDAIHNRAFTSSFDRTVKIWNAHKYGSSMELLGEWVHHGNVNFVAAAKHPSGMVATAADVPTDAVRVYSVDAGNISGSQFQTFSCSRITDPEGSVLVTEKWAYFPATMQWGLAEEVSALLLVGYSPRSRTEDDNDIPEDRRDSGELCLWDGVTGEKWRVTSVSRQNIFEVAWHPSQPCFAAATAPAGLDCDDGVKTQIRVFRLCANIYIDGHDVGRGFSPIKTLDCSAADINELTIMPNSYTYCYVTAGCTDGNAYVWDTALTDKPIHILRHGEPVEEFHGDREREDTGVKFTAWGITPDRFYTGSSDGVVKVWNVRSTTNPLVRDLIEVPAPVSFGMFAPNKSRLVIGDASGRVFLLSLDEAEQKPAAFVNLPGLQKAVRRSKPIIPHPEPPAPELDAQGSPIGPKSGPAQGRLYIEKGILQFPGNRDPTIGVVQGPNYPLLGLYDRRAHADEDPGKDLIAAEDGQQQYNLKRHRQRRDSNRPLKAIKPSSSLRNLHRQNLGRDLDVDSLSEELKRELWLAGADLEEQEYYGLSYEEGLSEDEFYGT